MKILIAEDSKLDRRLLESMLQREGFEFSSAATSDEALAAYREGRFDIALIDWMLPSVGGLSLIHGMREIDAARGRYCYVIVVTSKSKPEDEIRALESGADDFMHKPVDGRLLAARLKVTARLLALINKH